MADQLSNTFTALADPTRRAIVSRLSRSAATVSELAEPFEVSLPTVSRHIAVLERAGLVKKERHGQERLCTLDTARLQEAEDWLAEYRRFFEDRFDALQRKFEASSTNSKRKEPNE